MQNNTEAEQIGAWKSFISYCSERKQIDFNEPKSIFVPRYAHFVFLSLATHSE